MGLYLAQVGYFLGTSFMLFLCFMRGERLNYRETFGINTMVVTSQLTVPVVVSMLFCVKKYYPSVEGSKVNGNKDGSIHDLFGDDIVGCHRATADSVLGTAFDAMVFFGSFSDENLREGYPLLWHLNIAARLVLFLVIM